MSEFKTYKSLTQLANTLSKDKSLQKETHDKLNATVLFTVTNKKNKKQMKWRLYSKDKDVKLVEEKENTNDGDLPTDISVTLDDVQLHKLIIGKQSAQKLFMTGKLKIRGNVMKASFIEHLLKRAAPLKAKL
jgi:putative sterol carrier protein